MKGLKELTVNAEAETTEDIVSLLRNIIEQLENGVESGYEESMSWWLDKGL